MAACVGTYFAAPQLTRRRRSSHNPRDVFTQLRGKNSSRLVHLREFFPKRPGKDPAYHEVLMVIFSRRRSWPRRGSGSRCGDPGRMNSYRRPFGHRCQGLPLVIMKTCLLTLRVRRRCSAMRSPASYSYGRGRPICRAGLRSSPVSRRRRRGRGGVRPSGTCG